MPGFATRAIRAASRVPGAPQPPVSVPIYQTSTFEVASAEELADLLEFRVPGHSYTRYSNPTHEALEQALAALEEGEAAVVTASGMAAIHAVLASVLRPGDEVLAGRALYGGTYAILTGLFAQFGVTARFVPLTDGDAVRDAITDRTRLVWAETIANPTTDVVDLSRARDHRPRGRARCSSWTTRSPPPTSATRWRSVRISWSTPSPSTWAATRTCSPVP